MICYMDMTFCSAECATVDCPRNFTEEHREKARKWWGGPGGPPVAVRDFSEGCPEYVSCNQQAQVDQSVSAQAPLQSDNHREAEG